MTTMPRGGGVFRRLGGYTIKKIAVSSRIIKAVYFSKDDMLLRICFKSGDERVFKDVPQNVVNALAASPSPGEHYLNHIRENFPRLK